MMGEFDKVNMMFAHVRVREEEAYVIQTTQAPCG